MPGPSAGKDLVLIFQTTCPSTNSAEHQLVLRNQGLLGFVLRSLL